MKKYFIYAVSALLALAACTSDDLVDKAVVNGLDSKADNVMSFSVKNKNMSRATTVNMQDLGIYSFGVWGLKSTGSDEQFVMENYLVGYYDETGKGYYGADGETIGDQPATHDGKSMWFYDGLGSDQYKVPVGAASTFIATTPSVNPSQYIKYWDMTSDKTDFFAYVPYVNPTVAKFSQSKKRVVVGTIWSGFENPELNEHLLAYTSVAKSNYQEDVKLPFQRINASVRLAFYETIDGYKVKINSVKLETAHLSDPTDVRSIVVDDTDKVAYGGTYGMSTDSKIVTYASELYHIVTDDATDNYFGTPVGITNPKGKHAVAFTRIAEDRNTAITNELSQSPRTYYTVPADKTNKNSGFKLTIGYTLYSDDTNETMDLQNNVFIDSKYTQWLYNTKYLYVFRLTRDADGLYPIVFDGIKVEDYDPAAENEYDWIINADSNPTAAIAATLPTTIPAGDYTEFTVTNYVNDEKLPAEKVFARIAVNDASNIESLQYYESNPVAGLGWKNFVHSSGDTKVYFFHKNDGGFPMVDGAQLKVRIKPVSGLAQDTEIKANIQMKGINDPNTVYSSCNIKTKIQ